MGRSPLVPPALKSGPFTLDDAHRAGIGRAHLRGASWSRVGPGTYVWKELEDDPMRALEAARLRLPSGAAFSGLTAAWLHGMDVDPRKPIEVTVPRDAGVSARSGISVRRAALPKDEVTNVRGMRATSVVRSLAKVCSRLSLTEAVVVADMALYAGHVDVGRLRSWTETHVGRRGIGNLKRVIEHAEPKSESPMESRLRMLLVLAGLPRPMAQVAIHDRWRKFVGRPDLYYAEHRLGIEYDGESHRSNLAEDNRRQNRLLNAGVRLLRFTAPDVLKTPELVVEQVATCLATSTKSRSPD